MRHAAKRDDVYRAQKAVRKLQTENRPDLAAFSLALNSDREEQRSILEPLPPAYQKVTEYLTQSHE